MMKLQPYPAYRDSGVPWLGQVPEHWEATTIRRYSRVFAGATPSRAVPEYWMNGSIPWLSSGDVNMRRIYQAKQFITEAGFAASSTKWIKPGSLVVALAGQGRTKGMVATVECMTTCNQSLAVIEPSPKQADYRYLAYYLESRYLDLRSLVGDGLRDGLNLEHVRSIPTPIPPLSEQHAIARFLDHIDGRINRAIRAKRKLIALLNEQKQAIIHRAVTRGLDPDVPLRPSGVEWLGEVPAHWEVIRIKYLLREVDKRSTTGQETLLSLRMNHGLVPHDEHFARPGQAPTLVGYKVVHPGQIVLNRLQANNGLVFASDIDGVVSPDYAVFDAIGDVDLYYLTTLFRTPLMKHKFRVESKGLGTGTAGFLRLYTDRLGMIPVPLPPRDEQYQIMQALGAQLAGLNSTISRVEREIDLIREYRIRLIADVVTGKLDARAAVAGLPEELAEIGPEAADEDASFDAEPDEWEEEVDAP